MMVDGTEVGLKALLQRVIQLRPPHIEFVGARALIVSWDAGPEIPVKLQIHYGENGSGFALATPASAGSPPSEMPHSATIRCGIARGT